MKITITSRTDAQLDKHDWHDRYQVQLETDSGTDITADFHDGEPEDANIGRDFNDVYNIPKMLEAAYAAGKSGEELEITRKDEEDE